MTDLNVGAISGHLVADAVVVSVGRHRLTRFTLAVHDYIKASDVEDTYFFACDYWGSRAERISNRLVRGTYLALEYKSIQKQWTDDEGTRHKEHRFRVMNLVIMPATPGLDRGDDA